MYSQFTSTILHPYLSFLRIQYIFLLVLLSQKKNQTNQQNNIHNFANKLTFDPILLHIFL